MRAATTHLCAQPSPADSLLLTVATEESPCPPPWRPPAASPSPAPPFGTAGSVSPPQHRSSFNISGSAAPAGPATFEQAPRHHSRRPSGFSFTEIAMAVLVLAIAVLPVFLSFRQGTTGTIQTRDEVVAFGLAADLLSALQGLGFDQVAAASPQALIESWATTRQLAPDPKFQPTLTVTDIPPPAPHVPYQYKVLVVEIAWTSQGVRRSVKMSGLLFKAGL